MKQINIWLKNPPFKIGFLPVLFVVFLYLLIRNTGIYPVVFGDEWSYSSFSRLIPFREVPVPSYLYYTVFRLTNSCGDGFLECARIVNSLFFVGAAPLIFLIAKKVTSKRVASWIAILSILGPTNSFTAYFMPEAMYFFGFWLFTWTVFQFYDKHTNSALIVSAAVLGLLSMVKIHAVFLVPSFCAFLVYVAYVRYSQLGTGVWLRKGLAFVAIALLSAAAVRMTIGYLYAGDNGLDLFGTVYGGQAKGRAPMALLIPQALANLKGHLMAFSLLFGMPLGALSLYGISRTVRAESPNTTSALVVYTLLMLSALLAITVMFTAAVAGNGIETNTRLHMRYYDFVFPLFLIFTGSQIFSGSLKLSIIKKIVIAIPLAVLIVYSNISLLPAFSPNYIDSPELHGLTLNKSVFNALTGLSLVVLASWVVNARRGAQFFVFLFVPLFTLAAGSQMNSVMRQAMHADTYVNAGTFARQYLKKSESDQLTIVGEDAANLFKARFFVDNPKVDVLVIAEGMPIDLAKLSPGKRWFLVIGDHPAPPNAISYVNKRNFSLMQIVPTEKSTHMIDFSRPELDDYLVRAAGLSGHEPWGRWSNAKKVEFEFAWPLPRNLTLRLDATAFGPNSEKDFVVRVGLQKKNIRLSSTRQQLLLNFQTDGTEKIIMVDIPQPISPNELGLGTDARQLGIGLIRMEIGPTNIQMDGK